MRRERATHNPSLTAFHCVYERNVPYLKLPELTHMCCIARIKCNMSTLES